MLRTCHLVQVGIPQLGAGCNPWIWCWAPGFAPSLFFLGGRMAAGTVLPQILSGGCSAVSDCAGISESNAATHWLGLEGANCCQEAFPCSFPVDIVKAGWDQPGKSHCGKCCQKGDTVKKSVEIGLFWQKSPQETSQASSGKECVRVSSHWVRLCPQASVPGRTFRDTSFSRLLWEGPQVPQISFPDKMQQPPDLNSHISTLETLLVEGLCPWQGVWD